MKDPCVLVVAKRSAYETFVELRQDARTLELIAREDLTVAGIVKAHDEHSKTVAEVLNALNSLGVRARIISNAHEPFHVRGISLVVTVGGDGTLLAASHHVGPSIPVLGINSAPSTSFGFYCGLRLGQSQKGLQKALEGKLPEVELSRMQVSLNGQVVSRRVLNDALVCHVSPAATSRYILRFRGTTEEHKSSGFWIGPPAGSTAAQHSAGGKILPLASRWLQLVVREPIIFGRHLRFCRTLIPDAEELRVFSKMREARMFLDGPHMSLQIGLGDQLVFRRSSESLRVLGISRRRGRSMAIPCATC